MRLFRKESGRLVGQLCRALVFTFEFKLHDTAEAAPAQIHKKKYYEKYRNSAKNLGL